MDWNTPADAQLKNRRSDQRSIREKVPNGQIGSVCFSSIVQDFDTKHRWPESSIHSLRKPHRA
jgi:hypothetical protein